MTSKKTSTTRLSIVIPLTLLTLLFLVSPAFAGGGGGHLWFYSQDPSTLPGPQPLPNPQNYDPNYVSTNSDPWLTQSVAVPSGNWGSPFMIWLGCAQKNSTNTKLVISINKAANTSIQSILVNGTAIGPWNTSGTPPANLAPHGVFNSAEFFGYAEAPLMNLYSPPGTPYKTAINVTIILRNGATPSADAKVHFDAYGYTEEGNFIFSPYSHDLNFVIPEPATIFAVIASLVGLALFAYKRKNNPILSVKTPA